MNKAGSTSFVVILVVGGILIAAASIWAFHIRVLTPGQLWFVWKPDGIPASVKSAYIDLAGKYTGGFVGASIMKCVNASSVYWTAGGGFGTGPWEDYYFAADGRAIGGVNGSDVGGIPTPPVDLSSYQCQTLVRNILSVPASPQTEQYASSTPSTTTVNASTSIVVQTPKCSFTAAPAYLVVTQSAQLKWTCIYATTCSITSNYQDIYSNEGSSGTLNVRPNHSTTTYTLNCAGEDSKTSSSTVQVFARAPGTT